MRAPTTTPTRPTITQPEARPARRRSWSLVGPVLALAVAGVAVGRFVLLDDAPGPPSATTTAGAAPVGTPGGAGADIENRRALTVAQPNSPDAWLSYARATLDEAIATFNPRWFAVAEEALATTERLDPGRSDAATARAALLLSRHEFTAALDVARQAATDDPYSVEALAALVDAQVETGDLDAAEQTVARMMAIGPGVEAHARDSYLRQRRGDRDGARLAMRLAVIAAPRGAARATALTLLGDLDLSAGDVTRADRNYRAALAEKPDHLNATLGRARVLGTTGSPAEAAALLDAKLAEVPEPLVAVLRGELAEFAGDEMAARNAFALVERYLAAETAAGVRPDLEAARFVTAHGEAGAAVAVAQTVYRGRATAETADALAWALAVDGRPAEAARYAQEAIAASPDDPAMLVHAAVIAARLDRVDEARALLDRAVTSAPWLVLPVRPIAAALAEELGMLLPAAWR